MDRPSAPHQAPEAPLADPQDPPVEPRRVDIDVRDHLPVEMHAALGDQAPRVRPRHAERLGDQPGRWTLPSPAANDASAISSGSARSMCTRSNSASARRASSPNGSARPARARAPASRRAARAPPGRTDPGAAGSTGQGRVGHAQRLPVDLPRRLADPDLVAQRLRHLPLPVGPHQDRHRHDRLLGDAVRPLDVPPEEEVELLVGPPSSTSAATATESYPCISG